MTHHYGIATPDQLAGKTGREILQAIIDGALPQAPIGRTLGFHIVAVGDGFAAFEGQTSEDILNPMGGVHGGWMLTLIDSATGCAAFSTLPPGVGYTTVETKANFSRPVSATTGLVRCEATLLARGRTILSAEARVTDGAGRLLAHGTSTLLVLERR